MSQSSSSSPRIQSPTLAELATRLRAEQSASKPETPSFFAHESGLAWRAAGDDAAALRELVVAFNADPRFREPLEALLQLLEARPPSKNTGRIIEALVRAAETPSEKARALCKRGSFLNDHLGDEAGARLAFEAALNEDPVDATAWLELELLAGRQHDLALRARTLEARSKLTNDTSWRGLLLLDRASIEAQLGRIDAALELLQEASKAAGLARYPALEALEALALRAQRPLTLAEALESRGELIVEALDRDDEGAAFGVPKAACEAEIAADLFLRAAYERRGSGDVSGARRCIERALSLCPDEPILRISKLSLLDAGEDGAAIRELAGTLLDAGVAGSSAALLLVRVAEASRDDLGTVLEATEKALEHDPSSTAARAIELDALLERGAPSKLAEALERLGGHLASDEARARAFARAASVHALGGQDFAGALSALDHAVRLNERDPELSRMSRLFAAMSGDRVAYEEATSRLLSATAGTDEATSLSLELVRRKLLGSDTEGIDGALSTLAASPGGEWLAKSLLLHASDSAESIAALDARSQEETDPHKAHALSILAATRADALGDTAGAKTRLRDLLEKDPADEIAAIYLADLERQDGNLREAARVLAALANRSDDRELTISSRVEAFTLAFRAGARREGIGYLEATRGTLAAAEGMLAWALRGAEPAPLDTRERALDYPTLADGDAPSSALERFALEAFASEGEVGDPLRWLVEAEAAGGDVLVRAAALGRAIAGSRGEAGAYDRALSTLSTTSELGATLAAHEALTLARSRGDLAEAERAARLYADVTGSLGGAVEWLAASRAARDRDAEIQAWERIAQIAPSEHRHLLEAAPASILFGTTPKAPLPSTCAAASLINLELAALGSDPRRRGQALLANLDVIDAEVRLDALLLLGANQLAAGDPRAALESFQHVTEARSEDLYAWEGVRAAAEALGDLRSLAVASAHLGELCQSDERGAAFWEEAGLVLLHRLNEPGRAEIALEQAFFRDPTRSLAFDKLFRRVRESGQHERLLSLIARRLDVADDPAELAKLFWEQARALRQQGHRDEAIAALESVTAIEPDHVGAFALSGEIFIGQGKFAEAADALARLASLPQAPDKQRLMSGIAAVDLYENKLNDSQSALEILVCLHEAGLSNLSVRERLARAAAKSGSWKRAAMIFEELMNDRPTREGRIEAARLAMALWRDKLALPERSEKAARKLLAEAPGDLEAVEVILASPFEPASKLALLSKARDALVSSFGVLPLDEACVIALGEIAAALDDASLRQACLGTLVAIGKAPSTADAELHDFERRSANAPPMMLDDASLAQIADPEDRGPIATLFAAIAAPVADSLGPSLAAFGVGKRERLDPRGGFSVRNEIAAWAGALGISEVDVYIGGPDPDGAQGIPGDTPAIIIGTNVRAPLGARHRQAVARELFGLKRGIGVVRTRDEATVAAIVVAAFQIAEVPIEAPPYAILGDVRRQLGRSLPRKTKKLLPGLCREISESGHDPKAWARAAKRSSYRMAALAAGDVSIVLADSLNRPRRQLSLARDESAHRLLAFVLSPAYRELRDRLGMSIS